MYGLKRYERFELLLTGVRHFDFIRHGRTDKNLFLRQLLYPRWKRGLC